MSAQRWANALCVNLHREKLLSLPGPGGVSLHPTSQCSDREWSGPVKREGGRQSVRAITEPHTPGDQLHSQSVQRPRAWHEHHRSPFTPPGRVQPHLPQPPALFSRFAADPLSGIFAFCFVLIVSEWHRLSFAKSWSQLYSGESSDTTYTL